MQSQMVPMIQQWMSPGISHAFPAAQLERHSSTPKPTSLNPQPAQVAEHTPKQPPLPPAAQKPLYETPVNPPLPSDPPLPFTTQKALYDTPINPPLPPETRTRGKDADLPGHQTPEHGHVQPRRLCSAGQAIPPSCTLPSTPTNTTQGDEADKLLSAMTMLQLHASPGAATAPCTMQPSNYRHLSVSDLGASASGRGVQENLSQPPHHVSPVHCSTGCGQNLAGKTTTQQKIVETQLPPTPQFLDTDNDYVDLRTPVLRSRFVACAQQGAPSYLPCEPGQRSTQAAVDSPTSPHSPPAATGLIQEATVQHMQPADSLATSTADMAATAATSPTPHTRDREWQAFLEDVLPPLPLPATSQLQTTAIASASQQRITPGCNADRYQQLTSQHDMPDAEDTPEPAVQHGQCSGEVLGRAGSTRTRLELTDTSGPCRDQQPKQNSQGHSNTEAQTTVKADQSVKQLQEKRAVLVQEESASLESALSNQDTDVYSKPSSVSVCAAKQTMPALYDEIQGLCDTVHKLSIAPHSTEPAVKTTTATPQIVSVTQLTIPATATGVGVSSDTPTPEESSLPWKLMEPAVAVSQDAAAKVELHVLAQCNAVWPPGSSDISCHILGCLAKHIYQHGMCAEGGGRFITEAQACKCDNRLLKFVCFPA